MANRGIVGPAVLAALVMLASSAATAQTARLRSATGGAVRALIVGIDEYKNVRSLLGSVNDAEDLKNALAGAGVSDVQVLENGDATRDRFVAGMDSLVRNSKSGDLAIVAYSGHGASVPEYPQFKGLEPGGKTEEYIMVGYDRMTGDSREVVANKELKAWLSRLDAKGVDVLVISDSCFGGGMVRGGLDARAAAPSLRFLRDAAPADGPSSFVPIAMTPREKQISVDDLPHVTFLAGADALTPVPEVFIPASPTRRGALSYVVARAIEGKAAEGGSGTLVRRQLYSYVRQQVQHYSDDQRIDNVPGPKADDRSILERPVFRLEALKAPETKPPAMDGSTACPVKLAVLGSAAPRPEDLGKPQVPYSVVTDRGEADLIWDPSTRQVIQSSGDVVESDVQPGELAGIIDRTSAIACLKPLTDPRPQEITMVHGIKRYTPGDPPVVQAAHVGGRYLLVFNIASNGLVQMLFPGPGDQPQSDRDTWSYDPTVTKPFGADHLVAIASSVRLTDFERWLNDHDNRMPPMAGLLPQQIGQALLKDPTLRIGTVSLYTAEK